VLTGPSGVGKDSVLQRLKSLRPDAHFVITATTRPARPGERHEVDYYFLSPEKFEAMLQRGGLLEHANVYGQMKGVPKAPVREALARGEDVFFRTDVQGARYIKSIAPSAVTVFVEPPSAEELSRRLRERAADDREQMAIRLRIAEEEMAAAGEFDHRVVNDDLGRCATEIAAIVEEERRRAGRQPVSVG